MYIQMHNSRANLTAVGESCILCIPCQTRNFLVLHFRNILELRRIERDMGLSLEIVGTRSSSSLPGFIGIFDNKHVNGARKERRNRWYVLLDLSDENVESVAVDHGGIVVVRNMEFLI